VFPNQQIKIKDIYQPLTIVSTKDGKEFVIADKINIELFQNHKRILISDYAGMGKSTLMKWITLNSIETPSTIPILIELRKLDKSNSVIDEIFQQIDPIDKSFDKDLIIRFLELGFFTIILDGFDEIPQDIQESITVQLRGFIDKVSENNFILTSRPESALASFGDFQRFYIRSLLPEESFQIISRYDALNQIKYADKLIAEIEGRLNQVEDFLTNPFLVSLLYKSYTYNKDIPSKKTTFYEEVYSSLFKHHDSSKDGFKRPKHSLLDILDFRTILRHLAFETSKLGKVMYTEPELLEFISSAKSKNVNIDFKESSYVEDLLTTVPLFVREGAKIKWAHKSIQDYFAAEYITFHTKKEEILRRIYSSGKDNYLNIIDLIYELEPKLFRKIILLPLLTDFVHHYESSYKGVQGISEELINIRRSATFAKTFCVINGSSDIGFQNASDLFKKALNDSSDEFHTDATQLLGLNIFLLSRKFFKYGIIEILGSKNEGLFLTGIRLGGGFKNLKKLPVDVPFVITDEPGLQINDKDTFAEVNWLLAREHDRTSRMGGLLLDYKKVKKRAEQIEREVIIDNSNDDLKDI
jgi:hypothetical protein